MTTIANTFSRWCGIYDIVEFRHLKYFLAVAQEGSFTRAADRLHISQPSISSQIRQMEDEISAQLFVRENNRAMLTPAGKALLPFAEQVFRLREQGIEAARAMHSGTAPPLEIGISHFMDQAVIERAFACYRRLFPESEIRSMTHCTVELLTALNAGRIHAALVPLPIELHGLVIQPIARDHMLVCMRNDDPLAQEAAVSPRQLANRLRISFDPHQHPEFYAYLDSKLAVAGIKMHAAHVCTTPHDLQWMVKQGLGFALVRESRLLDSDLIARPIAGVELIAESGFIYRDNGHSSHLALLACELKNCGPIPPIKSNAATKIKPRKSALSQPESQMKLIG